MDEAESEFVYRIKSILLQLFPWFLPIRILPIIQSRYWHEYHQPLDHVLGSKTGQQTA